MKYQLQVILVAFFIEQRKFVRQAKIFSLLFTQVRKADNSDSGFVRDDEIPVMKLFGVSSKLL